MKDIESKYRNNKLSLDELERLRIEVNKTTDSELEKSMCENWEIDSIDTQHVSELRLKEIKQEIDSSIHPKRVSISLMKISQIAATILVPVLLLTTLYFYRENRNLSAEEMIVSTLKGEKANVTLPDGTLVAINSESSLRYAPQTYNKSERRVKFEGEAYFDVTKKEALPFVINTKDLEVKVLGTKFNLSARERNQTIELVLEEGHVLLLSSKQEKDLYPNQKAILNRATGEIEILSEILPKNASAWKEGKLIFENARLQDVLNAIENNYGIKMKVELKTDIKNDLFSGIITSSNLVEALEIIRISYHLNYAIVGKEVRIFEN